MVIAGQGTFIRATVPRVSRDMTCVCDTADVPAGDHWWQMPHSSAGVCVGKAGTRATLASCAVNPETKEDLMWRR